MFKLAGTVDQIKNDARSKTCLKVKNIQYVELPIPVPRLLCYNCNIDAVMQQNHWSICLEKRSFLFQCNSNEPIIHCNVQQ